MISHFYKVYKSQRKRLKKQIFKLTIVLTESRYAYLP